MVKWLYIFGLILFTIAIVIILQTLTFLLSFRVSSEIKVRNTPSMSIYIDSSFSPVEKEKIRAALRDWEIVLDHQITFQPMIRYIPNIEQYTWQNDGVITIYNAQSFLSWPRWTIYSFYGWESRNVLGTTTMRSKDIFLQISNTRLFQSVVAHEIGHWLTGSYHSSFPVDLMYPTIGKPKKISYLDTVMARAFWRYE